MGIVQHDKGDGDIEGTIEDTANPFMPGHRDRWAGIQAATADEDYA